MKTTSLLLGALAMVIQVQATEPQSGNGSTEYAVTERGAHHRVWERVEYETTPGGQQIPHVHSYTELTTGMHYKGANGEWVESKEEIQILPNGAGATATQGQHKVIFPPDLYDGMIELNTPDNKWLRSRVLGLSYFDSASGQSVLIAEIKASVGELHAPNAVIYPDAFTDLRADVRCTYTKAGFEQDIILRERPSSPAEYGLNPETTRLQVLTEFFSPPTPEKRIQQVNGMQDEWLDFGVIKVGRGKAFVLGDENSSQRSVRVMKSWQELEGRHFLIEEVEYRKVESKLQELPPPLVAVNRKTKSPNSVLHRVVSKRVLPTPKLAKQSTNTFQLAKANIASKPGYVLDYQTLNGSVTNFTFKGDTTYYVTNWFNLYGTTVIEGGTVIKYPPSGTPGLGINGPFICQTGPYRMAVLTSKDDNSVGETINGSSGTPTRSGFWYVSGDVELIFRYIRFLYSGYGVGSGGASLTFENCQFVNCDQVFLDDSGQSSFLRNVLVSQCDTVSGYGTFVGENVTFDQCGRIFPNGYSGNAYLTNCILTAVTNLVNSTLQNCIYPTNGAGIYKTVGGGSYYLADSSTNCNTGTTNISASLLAELKIKTTYPPIVYSNMTISVPTTLSPQAQRDTDIPDLGYHYDPIDHAFGGCDVNTNLTFTAGTAVGWFRTSSGWGWGGSHTGHAIHIADRQIVTFDGRAESPNYFVRCNVVQEGRFNDFDGGQGPGGILSWADQFDEDVTRSPDVRARYTRCSVLASETGSYFADDWGYMTVGARECEFWNGGMLGFVTSYYFTNCLFDRTDTGQVEGWPGNEVVYKNCTWRGGRLYLRRYNGWLETDPLVPFSVQNCAFDGTTIPDDDPDSGNTNITDYAYNAFLQGANRLIPTNVHDVVIASFNWQTGPLGNFYLPTNSALTNAGSTNANYVGLYHFTTQTNQVKETNSTVDIGYHYVAVNSSSQPIDTDGDGVPDYQEDANGNGSVNSGETDWQTYNSQNGLSGAAGIQVFTPLK